MKQEQENPEHDEEIPRQWELWIKQLKRANAPKEVKWLGITKEFVDFLQPGWDCAIGEYRLTDACVGQLLGKTGMKWANYRRVIMKAIEDPPAAAQDRATDLKPQLALRQCFK